MLYYRDLRVGSMDLTCASSGAVSELLALKPVRLSRLFPDAARTATATKSLKVIASRARVFAEEFGIHVTYLAEGFATWPAAASEENGGRQRTTTPRAPVLLRQVTITPRPGSVDGFEVAVTSEPQLNPVLLHLLEAQFGVSVDDATLLERATDDPHVLELFAKSCASALPGFRVDEGLVLGNFFYAEQPLVDDLGDEQAEFLAASHLVAALAGDEGASVAVRSAGHAVDPAAPDRCPPGDEFLVLDADGSQSYVVNAVAAGQNLVVQGPPGTGKSQTIANVIALLAAQNKRVLFVAQKRAAITAVLRRLEEVGLEHLVLDMFSAGNSRRAVVEEVSRVVEQRKGTTRPRVDALHGRLQENREVLVASHEAVHELRQPWNLPLLGSNDGQGTARWGLYDWALATAEHEGPVRLNMQELLTWSEGTHEHLRSIVADFVATGGTDPTLNSPGWSVSYLNHADSVAEGEDLADRLLGELLPRAVQALRDLAAELGVPEPDTPAEALASLDLAGAVDSLVTRGVADALNPRTSDDELAQQVQALAPRAARKTARKLGILARRRLVRATVARYPQAAPADLGQSLQDSQRLRARWRQCSVLPSPPLPPRQLHPAQDSLHSLGQAVAQLQPYVQGYLLLRLPFPELRTVLQQLLSDRGHRRYPRMHELRGQLIVRGCKPVLQDFLTRVPRSDEEAAQRLTQAFVSTVVAHLEKSDKRLAGVDSTIRDRAGAEFVKADVEARSANAQRVRRAAAERLATVLDEQPGQAEILRDQLRRKRGFKPVRQLMSEAPDVMLAAKPVWAASPQTVSELLPAQQLFDVVLFDEASQIQPAAALPAIARAAQTVVAGDSLQLPPTTLFTRTIEGLFDDDETSIGADEAEEVATGIVVRDMESILDAVETKLGPQRSRHLSWHYRSRDERLIATSNTYVYRPRGRAMTTFPAADGLQALQHVVVPPSSGLGANNKSPQAEVTAVVDLVLEHARASPHASLGVIAFGIEHADRIQRELERRLTDEPQEVRAWFTPTGHEPFFIKNIERVQGDERDKIVITVGYARGNDGQLRYNWGPVLQEGGHRRINVAISRAKSHLVLVTSFDAADIDERASDKEGFQLMRRFITFASTAGTDFGDAGAQPVELNPFEHDILRRLQEAGLDVTPQYGVGNYRLDFAVRHPHQPTRFVLAVEADGAAYHSGVVARERDRLRQQALEARGWRFVRIWSTDYFRDPESQVERVLQAYREALQAPAAPIEPDPAAAPAPSSTEWRQATTSRRLRPTVPSGLLMGQYSDDQLDAMVAWVRSDDLPHTRDEVFEMVKAELGFRKNGRNIVARIRAAVDRCM